MKANAQQFLTRHKWWLIGALTPLVVLVVVVITTGAGSANSASLAIFHVERGPLTISVSERGTIKARQQEIIKSAVEGQTTIIYLIDEGARAKKGDLLVELDSSKLQDQKIEQQIKVQNAEANFIRARENLEVVRNQAKADVAKAQLDAQFAREDLRKYDEGDYPKELRSAESKITIATEELQRAEEKLRWTEILFEEKYVSNTELQADRLAKKKAQLDLDLAKGELQLLQQYTYKRKLDELKSNVEQTALALERANRKAVADIAQAEAELKAKESEYRRQETQLAKTIRQIESCKMYAPTDGLVVYATTGQGNWRGNQEPLDEGQTVRERQDLIYLPTATDMMAEIKIHESNLNKVRAGLPVLLWIDAIPGRTFTGRIARIAPLPDASSMWMNPDLKVYNTEIHINGDGSDLKTGMSCHAQIIIENYTDAMHIPVQAVVRESGESVVYAIANGRPVRRVVKVGLDNNDRVHILDGLKVGESVWATPPIPTAINGDHNGFDKDIASLNAVASPAPSTTAPSTPVTSPTTQQADRPAGRFDPASLTPEQREAMRKRFESMTPEEREQMMQRRRARQDAGGQPPGERPRRREAP